MAMNDIWISKDGTKIKIKDMSNSHLRNSIEYFRPLKNKYQKRWELLTTEKKRRDKNKEKLENNESIDSRFDILDL